MAPLVAAAAIAAAAALALSCSGGKGAAAGARQLESEAIYRLVIARAERYDGGGIRASRDLIVEPIDSNAMVLIRKGMRHFTGEIEKAIADYNGADSGDSAKALGRANRTVKDGMKYRLSRIGFNELMNNAVLYELDNSLPELGHGTFIFLSKEGNEWAIDSEIMKQ